MKRPMTTEAATIRLESLCARSEHSTYELQQKLYKWGISPTEAAKIIRHLTDARFVDDNRFAQAYVKDKYRFARWGRRKISTGLYAKHIDSDTIDQALSTINNREYATIAFNLIASKLRTLPADIERIEKRQRLLKFGVGRGYETSLIIKILNSRRLWE